MPNSTDALAPVYDAALTGDLVEALARLDVVPAASLTGAQRDIAARIRDRFGDSPPGIAHDLPPITSSILRAYRDYWRGVMLRKVSAADGEAALLRALNETLPPSPDLDTACDAAREAIEAEGLYALTGITRPYYELMIWRRSTPTRYDVALPEQEVGVTVVFLEDFASLGWAAYATGDRSHTGGWATTTELYAVRQAYDLESESFRVSYLAHEGQHFADYARFPKLDQPELEYRAKLTELAVSSATTKALLERFAARTGTDRGIPHYFAHHHLVRSLDLGDARLASPDEIRAAARRALAQSTRELEARGAATVERWLGD